MPSVPAVLYNYIVVVGNGYYSGVVSITNLLHSITKLQVELARHANPLTSLPDNIAIVREGVKKRPVPGEEKRECIYFYLYPPMGRDSQASTVYEKNTIAT